LGLSGSTTSSWAQQSSPSQLFFSPRRGKSEVVIAWKKYQTKPFKSVLLCPRHPRSSSHWEEVSQRSSLPGGKTKPNQTKSMLAIPALLLTEEM
jgi:hypothetical protein